MPHKPNFWNLHPHTQHIEDETRMIQSGVCKITTITHPNSLASDPLALDQTYIIFFGIITIQALEQAAHVPASPLVAPHVGSVSKKNALEPDDSGAAASIWAEAALAIDVVWIGMGAVLAIGVASIGIEAALAIGATRTQRLAMMILSTSDTTYQHIPVKMRPEKGPWVTEDQGDCNGAIKTILRRGNNLLHTCNGAIKTKGKKSLHCSKYQPD